MSGWDAYAHLDARHQHLIAHSSALVGHIMNAKFALEAGDTKATVLRTLDAALALNDEYYRPMREMADRIRADAEAAKAAA